MTMLTVDGVCKSFGGVRALDGVDLTVAGGQTTVLIGPNGAGKTTLFNALTGFDSIDRGAICFEGKPIDGLSPWRIARMGLGRSFQTPTGFPSLTVRENLLVAATGSAAERLWTSLSPRRRSRHADDEALCKADSALARLGLERLADVCLSDVSVGDAKLVEIARQLVREPKVLLLDEPAAGVDPAQVGRLAERLRHLRDQGMTMLVIDHNLSFVLGVADHVHVLALGRVIASGPPAMIVRDERVRAVYLGGNA